MARVAMALLLVGSAAVALGPPEWRRVRELLSGGLPTVSSSLAVAVLLCWIAIGAVGLVALVAALRGSKPSRLVRSRPARALACLTVGVIALAAGVLHHGSSDYRLCCGGGPVQVQEARALVR